MIVRTVNFLAVTLLLLMSCSNESDTLQENTALSAQMSMTLSIDGTFTSSSGIDAVDIYSFAKKPGSDEYTYEKKLEGLIPVNNGKEQNLVIDLDGSLPRIIYFIANDLDRIGYLKKLSNQTTSSMLDKMLMIYDEQIVQDPLLLVGKVALPVPQVVRQLQVELVHTMARLDVVNKYENFSIDSLVLHEAIPGYYPFSGTIPNQNEAPRRNVKFEQNSIYLYPTDKSTLTVYGKYNQICAAFSVNLANIKSGTKYQLIIRGNDNVDVDFVNSFSYQVVPWNNMNSIESIPDWE